MLPVDGSRARRPSFGAWAGMFSLALASCGTRRARLVDRGRQCGDAHRTDARSSEKRAFYADDGAGALERSRFDVSYRGQHAVVVSSILHWTAGVECELAFGGFDLTDD